MGGDPTIAPWRDLRKDDAVTGEPWTMTGTLMIACNCDYGCPCNVNGRPTTGKCEGGWTWTIETPLDGLSFSIFADWPGAIHEGGGRAVGFLDERADGAQGRALERLMHGEAGGPWAVFANTYELDGPHRAPYEVGIAGETSHYAIGEYANLQMEPIRNPVSGAEVHPRLVLPEGLLTHDLGLYSSRAFSVHDGISYDHSGRYAAMGSFDYRGP
jgi:hypothetical protein